MAEWIQKPRYFLADMPFKSSLNMPLAGHTASVSENALSEPGGLGFRPPCIES
jgi:hypothetical protein